MTGSGYHGRRLCSTQVRSVRLPLADGHLLRLVRQFTRLSRLTFLRKHLHNHPRGRRWRLALMTLLFLMLLVGEMPTAFFNWANAYDSLVEQYRVLLVEKGVVEVTAANASSSAWCFLNVVDATRQYQISKASFESLHSIQSVRLDRLYFWQG